MRNLLARLFGGSCYLCRGAAVSILCPECDADLPRLGAELCPRCALASPRGELCGRCLAHPPHYDATVAALAYAFPADALVHALKFRGELALSSLLGKLLADRIARAHVDRVIAVPLTPARLRERGYNQSVEIARHVMSAKLDLEACVRTRDTAPQMGLPFDERRRNVRGAFECTRQLLGERIAVVDDVMTTGATLDEIAGTLKRAGAASVVNWIVTRTP
jgi:ComF family protein